MSQCRRCRGVSRSHTERTRQHRIRVRQCRSRRRHVGAPYMSSSCTREACSRSYITCETRCIRRSPAPGRCRTCRADKHRQRPPHWSTRPPGHRTSTGTEGSATTTHDLSIVQGVQRDGAPRRVVQFHRDPPVADHVERRPVAPLGTACPRARTERFCAQPATCAITGAGNREERTSSSSPVIVRMVVPNPVRLLVAKKRRRPRR